MDKPTRVRYQVLAAGFGLALLTYIHRQSFTRALPDVQTDLRFNSEQMGYLQSAWLIAYGVFQVPWGRLSDRFGARHILTILVLGWSLMTVATAAVSFLPAGLTATFVVLLMTRFLFGVFQAGGFPVWARVVADWVPFSGRASAQGMVWMFSRAGGALSPFLFSWLLGYYGTWSTPFTILATLGLVWCLLFWPWFRNRPEEMSRVNEAERQLIRSAPSDLEIKGPNQQSKERKSESASWAQMLKSKNVWGLCLMYGLVGFGGQFTTQLVSVYLAKVRELPKETVDIAMSLPLFLGIFSCAIGGFISDWVSRHWGSPKWGRRVNGAIGLTLAGLSILAVPWAGPTWLMAGLLAFSFFCSDLNIGPAWAACADIGRRDAGTISGAMNMTGQFFGAAAIAMAGSMFHRGQADLPFYLFGCAYGLAALCWLMVDVTKPLQANKSALP